MPRPARRGAEPAPPPLVSLLTDYGSGGLYVGLLHSVIARICPSARVLDLTHEIPAGDVLAGALALADALAFLPVGIHVAVVDPGVGTGRRALALRCGDGRVLIGPDNGLLALAVDLAGGLDTAVEISASPLALDPVSATFHGRDIFAPVAAGLAAGRTLVEAGALIDDPVGLTELELPVVRHDFDGMEVTVTAVDQFGNLSLFVLPGDLAAAEFSFGDPVAVGVGKGEGEGEGEGRERRVFARYGSTFADVGPGRLLLHVDSTGRLALAVNGASAAERLGARPGMRVWLGR